MSRCVLVLGTGRSGTSAIAGALYHLGCFMGEEFHEASPSNPYGTYEDVEFMYPDFAYLAGKADLPNYAPIIDKRESEHEIWGAKSPTFAHTARHFLPMLDDVRIIVAKRNPADTINSHMKARMSGRVQAEEWYEDSISAVAARLMEFRGPVLEVWFEDLKEDPETWVNKIMHFAFEDIHLPSNKEYNTAVKSIVKEPRRQPENWGNLAIGVRISKHPEPLFFNSWTQLLTGGVRNGDTVLMPAMHMPAHTAANKLAKDFMRTGKDTLLLVDDDMVFDTYSLHALRESRVNWEYDMVAPFCTHRTWPPKPVIMKSNGNIPEPEALKGASFSTYTDVQKGEVVEVDAVGLAFTLIRRKVFEAMMDEEWGLEHTYFFNYGPGLESDDIPFCRRARELGFRIAVDANVGIQHIGVKPYGWEDFEQWRREGEAGDSLDLGADTLKPILRAASIQDGEVGQRASSILEQIQAIEEKNE